MEGEGVEKLFISMYSHPLSFCRSVNLPVYAPHYQNVHHIYLRCVPCGHLDICLCACVPVCVPLCLPVLLFDFIDLVLSDQRRRLEVLGRGPPCGMNYGWVEHDVYAKATGATAAAAVAA